MIVSSPDSEYFLNCRLFKENLITLNEVEFTYLLLIFLFYLLLYIAFILYEEDISN